MIFTRIITVLLIQPRLYFLINSWKTRARAGELSELQPALQRGYSPEHDATSSSGPAAWQEQGKEAGDQPTAPKARAAGSQSVSSRGTACKQELREKGGRSHRRKWKAMSGAGDQAGHR